MHIESENEGYRASSEADYTEPGFYSSAEDVGLSAAEDSESGWAPSSYAARRRRPRQTEYHSRRSNAAAAVSSSNRRRRIPNRTSSYRPRGAAAAATGGAARFYYDTSDAEQQQYQQRQQPWRRPSLTELIIASAPQGQYIAPNLMGANGAYSYSTSSPVAAARVAARPRPQSASLTPISEQRHPGKQGVRLSRYSRPFEPDLSEEEEEEEDGQVGNMPSSDSPEAEAAAAAAEQAAKENWLSGPALLFLIVGLCLVVFLMSIDRTIITTAIPFITAEFHSTKDIGWYGSSYLLTACAFQPVFGRVYMLFDVKWSFLLSMSLFELGSLVCALSPSSVALIVGRAVAGLGSAGILTGAFIIVATAVPLQARPLYTAIVGLMFGIGATVGPLIGGLFTDYLTWRWCFWINLPVGLTNMLIMLLVFRSTPSAQMQRTILDRVIDLDLIGNVLLISASIMLFLALEFTTADYSWGDPTIIGLLAAFAVMTAVFITWQWWKADGALIPLSLVTRRTVAVSCTAAFCTYGALLIHSYFIPLWFQAILGYSAILSGVAMVPYCVANALFSLLSGIFVSVIGYFTPPAILGSAIATIGCGVIFAEFSPTINTAMWVGLEVLASAGFGMMIQQGFTAVQTVIEPEDIAVATAAVVASQSLGGAIFISVGNNVFQTRLEQLLADVPIDGLDPKEIITAGAIAFRDMFSPAELELLIPAYNEALTTVFLVAVPLAGLALVSCCFMEWRSVKKPPQTGTGGDDVPLPPLEPAEPELGGGGGGTRSSSDDSGEKRELPQVVIQPPPSAVVAEPSSRGTTCCVSEEGIIVDGVDGLEKQGQSPPLSPSAIALPSSNSSSGSRSRTSVFYECDDGVEPSPPPAAAV